MPATSAIMSQTFSMKVLHNHRFTAVTEIKNFLTMVCARVFGDILQPICKVSDADELRTGHLVIPGFPHPLFGDLTITPRNCRPRQTGTDGFVPIGGLWGWEPYNNTTDDDDNTLFVTFSRGFPVTKDEVVELFTRKLRKGSVVSVMMQENVVCGDQQTLFAKMMMR
ncbi:hypothetical protein LINPERHAP1_LOCUS7725 [Linum perenne]